MDFQFITIDLNAPQRPSSPALSLAVGQGSAGTWNITTHKDNVISYSHSLTGERLVMEKVSDIAGTDLAKFSYNLQSGTTELYFYMDSIPNKETFRIEDNNRIRTVEDWSTFNMKHLSLKQLRNLTTVPTTLFATCENLNNMFEDCFSLNCPLNGWDVSKVTTAIATFKNASVFNQTLVSWATGLIRFFTSMFEGASAYNQPMRDWDVSSAEDYTNFHLNATALIAYNRPLFA